MTAQTLPMTEDVQQYYSQLAPTYDENRFGNTYGQYIHTQEGYFLHKRLKQVNTLNLGCGTGRFMELANTGLDISAEMISEAQKKFPGKHFQVSDAEKMPFADETFAEIFSLHVFMHLSREKAVGLMDESGRILEKGGRFIFDFPSKRRRKLLRKKQDNWHGASAYTIQELKLLVQDSWNLKTYSGILFLPIHQMPKWSRKFFVKLDYLFCNSFLKEYASYLMVELEKK
jgi:ubiquinone/menaquinone biosynthesis C-methylase UbiE